MKQKPKTPEPFKCFCGAEARVVSDDGDFSQGGGYGFLYRVECQRNHSLTKYCGTSHRAICRWNNRINLHKAELADDSPGERVVETKIAEQKH